MRRILAVLVVASGVLLLGGTVLTGNADASAPAQEAPERGVVFESFMRST
jgi:hypothetical protein